MRKYEFFLQIAIDLIKLNREKTNVKQMEVSYANIGEYCLFETMINGYRTLFVSAYISPNTSFERIQELLAINIIAYSPTLNGLFEILEKYDNLDILTLVGGEMNLDLR